MILIPIYNVILYLKEMQNIPHTEISLLGIQ